MALMALFLSDMRSDRQVCDEYTFGDLLFPLQIVFECEVGGGLGGLSVEELKCRAFLVMGEERASGPTAGIHHLSESSLQISHINHYHSSKAIKYPTCIYIQASVSFPNFKTTVSNHNSKLQSRQAATMSESTPLILDPMVTSTPATSFVLPVTLVKMNPTNRCSHHQSAQTMSFSPS